MPDVTVSNVASIDFKKEHIDIVIEFSTAYSIIDNARIYPQHGISAIINTTG